MKGNPIKVVKKILSIYFSNTLFDLIDVAGVEREAVLNALVSEMNDFEDAIQAESAKQNDIKTIITRNKSDFKKAEVAVFTPDEFIQQHQGLM